MANGRIETFEEFEGVMKSRKFFAFRKSAFAGIVYGVLRRLLDSGVSPGKLDEVLVGAGVKAPRNFARYLRTGEKQGKDLYALERHLGMNPDREEAPPVEKKVTRIPPSMRHLLDEEEAAPQTSVREPVREQAREPAREPIREPSRSEPVEEKEAGRFIPASADKPLDLLAPGRDDRDLLPPKAASTMERIQAKRAAKEARPRLTPAQKLTFEEKDHGGLPEQAGTHHPDEGPQASPWRSGREIGRSPYARDGRAGVRADDPYARDGRAGVRADDPYARDARDSRNSDSRNTGRGDDGNE